MHLREYQIDALIEIKKNWDAGVKRQLIVLPTGAGKTVVMAHAIKNRGGRALFIAHRNELINQAYNTISRVFPEKTKICKISERNKKLNEQDIIVSTIQSLKEKRLQSMDTSTIKTIVIDEAHHSSAKSYRSVVKHFFPYIEREHLKKKREDKDILLLGCTATPLRADGVPIKGIFNDIVYSLPIANLIHSGHLVSVECRVIILPTKEDIVIRTRCGDFVEGDLNQLNTPPRNKIIVKSYIQYAIGLKTIVFCMSIKHSQDLERLMKSYGIKAKAVHGCIEKNEIAEIYREFKAGNIEVLLSCELLTEGFDEPSVECVMMCKPTKSEIAYQQKAGRGLRPHKDKKTCLILDFCNSGHSLRGACHMGCIDFYALITFGMMFFLIKNTRDALKIKTVEDNEEEEFFSKGEKKRNIKIVKKTICNKIIDILYSDKFVWVNFGITKEICTISSNDKAELQAIVVGKSIGHEFIDNDKYAIKLVYKTMGEIPKSFRQSRLYVNMYKENSVVQEYYSANVAISVAETFAEKNLDRKYYSKESTESNYFVSEKQLHFFSGLGITKNSTMGELNLLQMQRKANIIYLTLTEPPTEAQMKAIKTLNIKKTPKTKQEATIMLEERLEEIKFGRPF